MWVCCSRLCRHTCVPHARVHSHPPAHVHTCLPGPPPLPAAGSSSPQSPIWRAGQFLMVHLLCFKFSLLGKNSWKNGGKYVNFLRMVC